MHRILIIVSASKSKVLSKELVQRSMAGFYDHNAEEAESMFTRPTLDAYIVGKYWNFLTKGLSQEEIDDLAVAKENLDHYTRIYELMDYGQ
jgi:hypothetical protein